MTRITAFAAHSRDVVLLAISPLDRPVNAYPLP